jgi:hypothetical protein
MTKKNKLLLFLLFISITSFAQKTIIGLGTGGRYNIFQDSRFSDIQFDKLSLETEIFARRITTHGIWTTNLSFYSFNDEFPRLDTVKITASGYNISVGYLHHLNQQFYLGGTWDILDYYSRDNSMLSNSKNFYKNSSDILISGKYLYKLKDNWNFEFGMDYGLLSFVNSAPSFTANFPQNVVDDGNVSFMNNDARDPHAFKYMTPMFFWEQFYLKTHIEVQYAKRLSLEYSWDLRTWANEPGYPVTIANHHLTLKYNIVNHSKQL